MNGLPLLSIAPGGARRSPLAASKANVDCTSLSWPSSSSSAAQAAIRPTVLFLTCGCLNRFSLDQIGVPGAGHVAEAMGAEAPDLDRRAGVRVVGELPDERAVGRQELGRAVGGQTLDRKS